MKRATLLMVLHNHQPVGNFDHVFEECTDRCYHPTLEVLREFPDVRLTLHCTGPLLEWFLANRPETIELIAELAGRGQIEVLGGCHNEAMPAVLPDRDVLGQVATMRGWCETHLGQSPRGMWLAERVWEPDLSRILHSSGVEYTLLDDIGFRFAGLDEPTVWGHFVAEKAGHPITIFPIDQQLRYLIPFEDPQLTLDHLSQTAEHAGQHVWLTYGDDGEKFGVWPRTWERVFGKKQWLRRFFEALTENRDTIGTATLSEAVDSFDPRGRIYLPTCSYDEMMEWAQPTETVLRYEGFRKSLKEDDHYDAARGFVRGGIWQSFLAKYPEADRMHKRMIGLSERVDSLRGQRTDRSWLEDAVDGSRGEPPPWDPPDRLFLAQQQVYRAQCNDAYWHGLFGGLYLSNLRHKVWEHLLAAEALLDSVDPPTGEPEWVDVNLDGRAECVIANEKLHVQIEPHAGGALTELSFKPRRFCLTNTLCRRPEHYHEHILNPPQDVEAPLREPGGGDPPDLDDEEAVSIHDMMVLKEEGLEDLLVYDEDGPLACLRDRFLDPDAQAAQWCADARTSPHDAGDFASGEYAVGLTETGLELTRTGSVGGRAVRVLKRIAVEGGRIDAGWTLELVDGGGPLEVAFAPEMAFSLHAPRAKDRYFEVDGQKPEDPHMVSRASSRARTVSLVDEWTRLRLDLTASWDCEWWRAPVESASASESGIERIYQASVLLPRWLGRLEAGVPVELALELSVSEL